MIIFIGLVVLVLIGTSIQSAREQKKKQRLKFLDEYQNPLNRVLDYQTMEQIRIFDEKTSMVNPYHIDRDTWDDLDMDSLYMEINNTNSAIGREYLYYLLHNPCANQTELEEINRVADYFADDEKTRLQFQEIFSTMGESRYQSVYRAMDELLMMESKKNFLHYLIPICYLLSILFAVFVKADLGIIAIVISVCFAVITYYREKAQIENSLIFTKNVVRMVSASGKLSAITNQPLNDYIELIQKDYEETKVLIKNYYFITTGSSYTGSLFEVAMDYLRILFHIDLIRFNQLVDEMKMHQKSLLDLYHTIGFLESMIAVAAYRNKLPYWSVPHCKENQREYTVKEVYHPLIDDAVSNSILAKKSVLLTGSNASGKSTFLRTIAINALLSQTIATSVSREYYGGLYHIVSSMSHRDDLLSGDSYYMVEIKSIKRILDMKGNVLCFLDEVLRGTNTVERIAASTQILKQLAQNDIMCFAATHDIELTRLLDNEFDNYHFDESFVNDDVKYSYQLLQGPASTRNAIRLLLQNGYDKKLVEQANAMTKIFEKEGIWVAQ